MISSFDKTKLLHIAVLMAIAVAITSGCTKEHSPTWTNEERAILRSLSLSAASGPPASPSNRVADNPKAVEFGKALFFDPRLSRNNDFSCATCHQPARLFSDGRSKGLGVNPLSRNTPSLIGSAWQNWFYWDGRRDSLWAQALIPIEAPDEMGGSRSGAVRLIASDKNYLKLYTELFGPVPPMLASGRLPEHAGEFTDAKGKDAWYRLPARTQNAINKAYSNIGKAIAAYERTLVPKPTVFDQYVEELELKGEEAAGKLLSASAINGAKLFINFEKTKCLQCHNGPMLTNGDFHNVGTGTLKNNAASPNNAKTNQPLDFGRLFGVQAVLLDQFNCLGPHSDAQPEQCSALRFLSREQHGDMAGAFKTPSLRHVAQTGPYFHDGRFNSLDEVMEHYINPPDDADHELIALDLTPQQSNDLVAFMKTLNATQMEPSESAEPVSSWTDSEKTLLATLSLSRLGPAPPDPGNAVFDSESAAQLGEALFNDSALSANGNISCASCHQEDLGLGDGRKTAIGLGPLNRNAPGLTGVAWRGSYYWDGRKDSLWSQALEPIESENEMGSSRQSVVDHVLNTPSLQSLYTDTFTSQSIEHYERTRNENPNSEKTIQARNKIFSNLGKAIAAFEHTLAYKPTRFDAWVDALIENDDQKLNLLSTVEQAGLRHFISGETLCVTCHNGPRFTDGLFHNIGTGPGDHGHDKGRAAGIKALVNDPFNCRSVYNDTTTSSECTHLDAVNNVEVTALLNGAFRTPGLRELSRTGPYMHDGRFDTLEAVLEYYAEPADKRTVYHELVPIEVLDDKAIEELAAFLKTLSDTVTP